LCTFVFNLNCLRPHNKSLVNSDSATHRKSTISTNAIKPLIWLADIVTDFMTSTRSIGSVSLRLVSVLLFFAIIWLAHKKITILPGALGIGIGWGMQIVVT
jgi:hypothetical protein